MKASTINFIEGLFGNNDTFLIPCYQRPYAWKEKDCELLWDNISNLIAHPNLQEHFMGTIIFFDVGNNETSSAQKYWIIDGQQRVTTIYVILKALYDLVCEKEGNEILVSALKTLLFNSNHLKLIPKENDNDTLRDIFYHSNQLIKSNDLIDVYYFFKKSIKNICNSAISYGDVFNALNKLNAVKEIFLSSDNEDPHTTFEHVNARRVELTLTDKVRNFLLLADKYPVARYYYNAIWKPMEEKFIDCFADKDRKKNLDEFVLKFLQLKIKNISNKNAYEKFRVHLNELIAHQEKQINLQSAFASADSIDDDENDEVVRQEPKSEADNIRLIWLNELSYYSYFYILFSCNYYDENGLKFGEKEAKLGNDEYKHIYHGYSWNIRVILYWFRMLNYTDQYCLFFKLFEWEDKKKISSDTLEKVLLLILNYVLRYAIKNKDYPIAGVFNSLLENIYHDENTNETEINDANCYKIFLTYFQECTKTGTVEQIYSNGTIINAVKENDFTDPHLLTVLFLLIYYKTLLFPIDKFYEKKLHLIFILPSTIIEDFNGSKWLENDPNNNWIGLGKQELHWMLTNLALHIGNITLIDDKVWTILKQNALKKDKVYKIDWFLLHNNDFITKKDVISHSKFVNDFCQLIIDASSWNSTNINQRTNEIAKKIIEYLPPPMEEDNYGSQHQVIN